MSIDEHVQRIYEMPREDFVEAHPQYFLLFYKEDPSKSGDWTFRTSTVRASQMGLKTMMRAEASRYQVFSLTKAAESPWQERISVGRARNNDICILETSVSKLQAHFWLNEEGQMQITDAGSRNGTLVAETVLKSGENTPLTVGDLITFGAVSMQFVDAGTLYDTIKRQLSD
jgi:hypothetical protein